MSPTRLRVPYAPRVPPEAVCALAVLAAAAALVPLAVRAIAEVQRDALEPTRVAIAELAAPVAVGALAVALAVIRTRSVGQSLNACLAGGLACGVGCVGFRALDHGADALGAPAFALGVALGLGFGAACLYPASELAAARDPRAHATTDVQISNTSAWIAVLATAGFFAAPTRGTWWFSAVLAASSLGIAVAARVRHALRRRWLLRVLAGDVEGWAIEPASSGARDAAPVIELLDAADDERVVVTTGFDRRRPYRDARAEVLRGRLTPNF